jgi:hypothetical protein
LRPVPITKGELLNYGGVQVHICLRPDVRQVSWRIAIAESGYVLEGCFVQPCCDGRM